MSCMCCLAATKELFPFRLFSLCPVSCKEHGLIVGYRRGETWLHRPVRLVSEAGDANTPLFVLNSAQQEFFLCNPTSVERSCCVLMQPRMGAARIQADLGRLYARLGPKGTEASPMMQCDFWNVSEFGPS